MDMHLPNKTNVSSEMNLPSEVKIGGHSYKVFFPYVFKERSDVGGFVNFGRNEIMLADIDANGNKLPRGTLLVRFLHEIIHAIIYQSGQEANIQDEEALVIALSEGLFQVLNDNGLGGLFLGNLNVE